MDSNNNDILQDIKKNIEQINNNNNILLQNINNINQKLIGLIEINARLTQEIVILKSDGTNNISPDRSFNVGNSDTKPKGVIITVDEDIIKVSGNTYKHRTIFAEHGGTWKGEHKHWEIHIDKKDELIDTLKEKDIEHIVN